MIAAVAKNGCIGRNGKIPWRCPEDLKRFKKQTMGYPIVMGRKTYESLGKPLSGRINLVVTHNFALPILNGNYEDLFFCKDLWTAFDHCRRRELPEVFIIGGSEIYKQCLVDASELRITKIPDVYDGDTFFPEWPISDKWVEVEKETGHEDPRIEYVTYRRLHDS